MEENLYKIDYNRQVIYTSLKLRINYFDFRLVKIDVAEEKQTQICTVRKHWKHIQNI